jgi:hypothetical protein
MNYRSQTWDGSDIMLCTGKLETYGWDSRDNGSSDGQGREESEDASQHVKRLGDCEVGRSTGIA